MVVAKHYDGSKHYGRVSETPCFLENVFHRKSPQMVNYYGDSKLNVVVFSIRPGPLGYRDLFRAPQKLQRFLSTFFSAIFLAISCAFCSKTCAFAPCDLKRQRFFCGCELFGTQRHCLGQTGTVPGTNRTCPWDKWGPVPGADRPFCV